MTSLLRVCVLVRVDTLHKERDVSCLPPGQGCDCCAVQSRPAGLALRSRLVSSLHFPSRCSHRSAGITDVGRYTLILHGFGGANLDF